jgi:hypothetical protein
LFQFRIYRAVFENLDSVCETVTAKRKKEKVICDTHENIPKFTHLLEIATKCSGKCGLWV